MNGPRHYLEAERLLARAAGAVVPDSAGQFTAEAQVHATLALAAATALAIDPTPEAVAVWDPLVLEGKDGDPVEARLGPVCGTPLHPPAPDDVEPCGIRCVLDDGHEDYHSDGHGNRWTT